MEAVLNKVSQLSPQCKQNNPITNNGGFVPFTYDGILVQKLCHVVPSKVVSHSTIDGLKVTQQDEGNVCSYGKKWTSRLVELLHIRTTRRKHKCFKN